jgi:hypothetical protein
VLGGSVLPPQHIRTNGDNQAVDALGQIV